MLLENPLFQNTAPSRIIPPDKDQVRARKVVFRSNYGHVYKFQSLKFGRCLHLGSGLERERVTIHEFDPDVIYIQEQPFTLEYTDEGKIRFKFPDILVFYDNGSMIIEEIKPASIASDPEIKRIFDLEKMALEQHGYGFAVFTEIEIRSGLLLKNSIKLKPYRRTVVSAVLREKVLATLRDREMSGRDLIQQVNGLSHDLLLSLLSQGIVSVDLTTAQSLETLYRANKRLSQLTQQQLKALERRCV